MLFPVIKTSVGMEIRWKSNYQLTLAPAYPSHLHTKNWKVMTSTAFCKSTNKNDLNNENIVNFCARLSPKCNCWDSSARMLSSPIKLSETSQLTVFINHPAKWRSARHDNYTKTWNKKRSTFTVAPHHIIKNTACILFYFAWGGSCEKINHRTFL